MQDRRFPILAKLAAIDVVLLDFVGDDAAGGIEELGRLDSISAGLLQRFLDEMLFECANRFSQ